LRLAAQVGQDRRDLRDHLPRQVADWCDLLRGTLAGQPVHVASPHRCLGGIVRPSEQCGNNSRLGVTRPRSAEPGVAGPVPPHHPTVRRRYPRVGAAAADDETVTAREAACTVILVAVKLSFGDAESQGDLAYVRRHDDPTFVSRPFGFLGEVRKRKRVHDNAVLESR